MASPRRATWLKFGVQPNVPLSPGELGELVRDRLVVLAEQDRAAVDLGDSGAQRGEHVGELGGHIAATHDHHPLGQLLEPHHRVAGVVLHLVESGYLGHGGPAPCCDHDLVGGDLLAGAAPGDQ